MPQHGYHTNFSICRESYGRAGECLRLRTVVIFCFEVEVVVGCLALASRKHTGQQLRLVWIEKRRGSPGATAGNVLLA